MRYLTLLSGSLVLLLTISLALPSVSLAQVDQPINRVIEKLQLGEPAIGTFSRAPSSNLDFAVIDEQYGEFDIEGVHKALTGMQTDNAPPVVAPIVRIPLDSRDDPQAVVQQLLDAGVYGIMFPDVETRAQAEAAISSMRFDNVESNSAENQENPKNPTGQRAINNSSAPAFWGLSGNDYRAVADVWPINPGGKLLAMIQIESLKGIENLDAILEVPGIAVLFLGPTDLATSIGATGPDAPEVESLVQDILQVCLSRDIACGYPIVASSPADADRQTAQRLTEGFRVLAVMTRAQ